MKKHIYLVALIALVSLTLNITSAKAEANHREPQKTPATCLPINNNVIYLLVAGVAIGVVAVVRRKSLKANR